MGRPPPWNALRIPVKDCSFSRGWITYPGFLDPGLRPRGSCRPPPWGFFPFAYRVMSTPWLLRTYVKLSQAARLFSMGSSFVRSFLHAAFFFSIVRTFFFSNGRAHRSTFPSSPSRRFTRIFFKFRSRFLVLASADASLPHSLVQSRMIVFFLFHPLYRTSSFSEHLFHSPLRIEESLSLSFASLRGAPDLSSLPLLVVARHPPYYA